MGAHGAVAGARNRIASIKGRFTRFDAGLHQWVGHIPERGVLGPAGGARHVEIGSAVDLSGESITNAGYHRAALRRRLRRDSRASLRANLALEGMRVGVDLRPLIGDTGSLLMGDGG